MNYIIMYSLILLYYLLATVVPVAPAPTCYSALVHWHTSVYDEFIIWESNVVEAGLCTACMILSGNLDVDISSVNGILLGCCSRSGNDAHVMSAINIIRQAVDSYNQYCTPQSTNNVEYCTGVSQFSPYTPPSFIRGEICEIVPNKNPTRKSTKKKIRKPTKKPTKKKTKKKTKKHTKKKTKRAA